MARKKKNSLRTPRIALKHYLCAECGLECEAPKDSKCKHCGCVMDIVKRRMK